MSILALKSQSKTSPRRVLDGNVSSIILLSLLLVFSSARIVSAAAQLELAGDLIVNLQNSDLALAVNNVWTNQTINPKSPGNFTLRSGSTLPLTTVSYGPGNSLNLTALNVAGQGNNIVRTASGSNAPVAICGTNSVTVEAWVYSTDVSFGPECVEHYGVGSYPPGGNQREFNYTGDLANGNGAVSGYASDANWSPATFPTANVLHQLVYQYDGANFIIYQDGVLNRSVGLNWNTVTSPMGIGGQSGGGDAFRGSIAACRMMSGVLTPSQVLSNFNLGPLATYMIVPLQPTASPAPNVFVGDVVTLSDTIQANESLTYQWLGDNGTAGATFTAIGGATASSYNFNTTGVSVGNYQFKVAVTGNSSGVIATSPPIVINVAPSSPAFVVSGITPVAPTNIFVGYDIAFTATVGGNLPITNYWQKSTDGGLTFHPLTAVNNSTLTLTNLLLSDSGVYRLAVTNKYGGAVSGVAALTVQPLSALPLPQVAGQLLVNLRPQDLDPTLGVWPNHINGIGDFSNPTNLVLSVVTNSYKNATLKALGVNGVGGQSVQSALQVPLAQTGRGTISVEEWIFATNVPASGNNTVAYYGSPGVELQRAFDYSSSGGSGAVSFYADDAPWNPANVPTANVWHYVVYTYDGTIVKAYQDGVLSVNSSRPNINTAQSAFCVGASLGGADAFTGYIAAVRVHDGVLSSNQIANNYLAGPLQSVNIILGVSSVSPTNVVFYGDVATISVATAQALNPLTFQWQTDGGSAGVSWGNIASANSTNYVFNTATLAAPSSPTNRMFRLIATDGSTSATNSPVTVTVNPSAKPSVLSDVAPLSVTVYQGDQVIFSASFTGNKPLTNQWQISSDNGVTFTNLPGATDTSNVSTLVLTNLQVSQSGEYRLKGSNAFGSSNSTAAFLTVLPKSARPQVQSTGELIADLESSDLSGTTGTWVNHSMSPGSVGDFTAASFDFLNVTNILYNFQPVNVLNVSSVGANSVFSGGNVPVGITGNGSVSVEAWVFPTGSAGNSTAVSYGIQGGSQAPMEQREFNYNDGGNGAVSGFFGSFDTPWNGNPVSLNTWHYLVWTYDGTTLNVYMDGVLNNTHNPGTPLVTTQTQLLVGSALNGSSIVGADPFKGYIASVRVHTGILSSSQVSNNYGAGPGAVTPISVLAPFVTSISNKQLTMTWQTGTLQSAPTLLGPWTNVGGATSPYVVTPNLSVPKLFYRLMY